MTFEWGWGAQPDEWFEDDWFDENGNYHDISELGGLRKEPETLDDDMECIAVQDKSDSLKSVIKARV